MPRPPAQTEGLGLHESHRHLEAKGFHGQFSVAKMGRVLCGACGTSVPAKEVAVHSQKRIEGVSDPDDESLVFGLECPACGARGTLTTSFGPRAGRDEAAVVADLPPPGLPPAPHKGASEGRPERPGRSAPKP